MTAPRSVLPRLIWGGGVRPQFRRWKMSSIGVPIKLLYEAQGLIVSIEVSTGQTYRGKLLAVEDNMNVQLKDVTVTHRDGHVTAAEQCFLRGSQVRTFVLPDNLRHAPMFKNFGKRDKSRGLGMGKAREEVARAQAMRGGKSGLAPQRR